MRLSILLGVVASAMPCCAAYAGGHGRLDLGKGIRQADVVCVGEVSTRTLTGRESGGSTIELQFHVDRVIKGSVPAGSSIRIIYDDDGVYADGRVMDTSQSLYKASLVLLKRTEDAYTFVFRQDSTMEASDQNSGYVQTTDVSANLRSELRNSLKSRSKSAVSAALSQVHNLSKDDVRDCVLPLVGSSDSDIQTEAMGTCLSVGEFSVMQDVITLLTDGPIEPQERPGRLNKLASRLAAATVDPLHLHLLGDALSSAHPDRVRKAACHALRNSRTALALPYLRTALYDADAEVRYDAMLGMAQIVEDVGHTMLYKDYMGNPEAYEAYLNYWKSRDIR